MIKQSLQDGWELCYQDKRLPATIPFSVYYNLYESGEIDDPFYRDNESKVFPLSDEDYVYLLSFHADQAVVTCKNLSLVFRGVDTIAEVYLNDTKLGDMFNMHRSWEFLIDQKMLQSENILKVYFHSPTRYMAQQSEKYGRIPCNTDTLDGFPYLRKASYMSGWDWAPRLPDVGIIGEAALVGWNHLRIRDVLIRQQHEEEQVILQLTVNIEPTQSKPDYTYCVTIVDPLGGETTIEHSPEQLVIDEPMLWWPNGFGEQFLYEIKVEVRAKDGTKDVWQRKIGLRTVTIDQGKDEWGENFAHRINGMNLFAMGADYIPEDSLLPKVTKERTRALLCRCKEANYNTVRVWGGGYYPPDWFYEICDELGLLVWQDLMFTCSTYLLTEEFERNIRAEIIENVRRIRHHACLALWCGNNEIEGFLYNGFGETPRLKGDYGRIFSYIIPQIIKKEDPDAFYWPSSPSSGGDFDDPQDEHRGDAHYWQVWHGYQPFPDYRNHYFRYASEFGFESLPAMKTIETFTEPEDRNLFSYVMERHQKSDGGYAKMMNYTARNFLYPKDLKAMVYTSQIMQAEAMKYAVEHFRRNRGRCMGAIIWQLNDCWPVTSWSSIDYYGRLKALHYYEKRFFAPVLVSCCEEGMLTQDPNPNARPYDMKKSIQLNVTNETTDTKVITVSWSLRDSSSQILGDEHIETVTVPPLSSVWLDKVNVNEARLFEDHVYYCGLQDGCIISEGTVIFSIPKFYNYKNPGLTVYQDGGELVVTADAYAKCVEISNQEEDLVLSDNFFDMEAGTKRISVLSGRTDQLMVRSTYHIANEPGE